jgi:hypothetical protein
VKLYSCTAAFLFIVGVSVSSALAGPQVTLSESRFDFGMAPQNAKLSHTFWIHSTGDQELKIIKVYPGCGCTQAPLEKTILPVGDSTRLEIIFSTGAYVGQVVKRPSFTTNADSSSTGIVFLANIRTLQDSTKPIRINPNRFDLTPVGEGKKVEFKIRNVSNKDVTLTMVSCPNDLLEVKLPEKISPGDEKSGSIKLTSKAFENTIEKSFTFEVNDGQATRFTVPVVRLAVAPGSRVKVPESKEN